MPGGAPADSTVFVTLAATPGQARGVRLLTESIRSFGGALSDCRILVFQPGSRPLTWLPGPGRTSVVRLVLPSRLEGFPFAGKVCACAEAEDMADGGACSLVWLSHDTLVVSHPGLFDLRDGSAAAVRPVHVKNVGVDSGEPLDGFWSGICRAAGIPDISGSVETFVEGRSIRPYYNSHAISVDPSLGLFRRWLKCFSDLVSDGDFLDRDCRDGLHRVFLHQAVLSALVHGTVPPGGLRLLPPAYSYPYNLQQQVPPERRARAMEELVSMACEERTLDPDRVDDISIGSELTEWLSARREMLN